MVSDPEGEKDTIQKHIYSGTRSNAHNYIFLCYVNLNHFIYSKLINNSNITQVVDLNRNGWWYIQKNKILFNDQPFIIINTKSYSGSITFYKAEQAVSKSYSRINM